MTEDIEARLQSLEAKVNLSNMVLQYLLRTLRQQDINIDPELRFFRERMQQESTEAIRGENMSLFVTMTDCAAIIDEFLDNESDTTHGTPIRA